VRCLTAPATAPGPAPAWRQACAPATQASQAQPARQTASATATAAAHQMAPAAVTWAGGGVPVAASRTAVGPTALRVQLLARMAASRAAGMAAALAGAASAGQVRGGLRARAACANVLYCRWGVFSPACTSGHGYFCPACAPLVCKPNRGCLPACLPACSNHPHTSWSKCPQATRALHVM
jgi:hypothetical protein